MTELDYRRNALFWEEVSRREESADLLAAQNPVLSEPVHRLYRARQIEFVRALIPDRADVLDLGCGPGVWALELADRVRSWLGVDIAPGFVEHARREAARRGASHLAFEVGALQDFPISGKYGLVVMGATLGHLNDADVRRVLGRVRAHLAPDGLAYVRAAVSPWPYPRYARRGKFQSHYRSRAFYESCFRGAGFRCDAVRDLAYTEATLATLYAGLGRVLGATPERSHLLARRLSPLTFRLARHLLDLTPLPQSYHFVLRGDS